MAYTILNTDGTTLLLLPDGQIDRSATSLTLIGRNYASYGQELNNNFIKLLANFASTSGSPPRSPIKGQLWYDTTDRRIKVYDNGFKTVGAVEVSITQPTTLQTGDLWFDQTSKQLKIYSSGQLYTVGPTLPLDIGLSGLVLADSSVRNQEGVAQNVILLKNYGTTIGLTYYDPTGNDLPFEMDNDDRTAYAPNLTTSTVVSGVTVIGDLNVTGKLSNNYLSLHVDLDIVSPNPNNDAVMFYGDYDPVNGQQAAVAVQNPAIARILNQMFPPTPTNLTNTTTIMSGVILGTQARVLCKFSRYLGTSDTGYQVRVFRTVGDHTTSTWQPYYFRTDTIGSTASVLVNYISTSTS